jgi:ubiquinone/menaquinone biosynthesis C-methylase UbiE
MTQSKGRVVFLLTERQIVDLIAHKNPRATFLQVGGVTPELTRKVLSILNASDITARRFKSISFFDGYQELINNLATQYEGLKSTVEFAHTESQKVNLPPELKDSSIDLVLLSSQGLEEQQWTELLSHTVRILKPNGKLLVIGALEHNGAE